MEGNAADAAAFDWVNCCARASGHVFGAGCFDKKTRARITCDGGQVGAVEISQTSSLRRQVS